MPHSLGNGFVGLAATVATLHTLVGSSLAETATQATTFEHSDLVLEESHDTGWLPEGENFQVRLVAGARAGVESALPGIAELEREARALRFSGDLDQGTLWMGLETEVHVYFRIVDVEFAGLELDFEGEIPLPEALRDRFLPVIADEVPFTPFALPGAAARPVSAALSSPKFTLVTLSATVIETGVLRVQVQIPLRVRATLECDLSGEHITVTPAAGGSPLAIALEGDTAAWPDVASRIQEGSARYQAERRLAIVLSFLPAIEVRAEVTHPFGSESETWLIHEFEIPWEVAHTTSTWQYAPVPLLFEFAEDLDDGDQGNDGDDPDTSGDDDVPRADDSGGDGHPDSDGDPLAAESMLQGGCSVCAANHRGPVAGSTLFALLITGLLVHRCWRHRRVSWRRARS